MSVQAMSWAFEQRVAPTRKIVLLAIANCADANGDNAFPGQKMLADLASMSVRSVIRHLIWLEANGYVTRIRRVRMNGSRTSDRYVLSIKVKPKRQRKRQGANLSPDNGGRTNMTLLAGQ